MVSLTKLNGLGNCKPIPLNFRYIKIDKVINPDKYIEKEERPPQKVAGRIIKSCLSANNFINKQQSKEKAKAQKKSHKKFTAPQKAHKVKSSDYMSEDSD